MDQTRGDRWGWGQRLMADGPPLSVILFVFVLLQTPFFGVGDPVIGLAILALGLVAAFAVDFDGRRRDPSGSGGSFRFAGAPRPSPPERPRRSP